MEGQVNMKIDNTVNPIQLKNQGENTEEVKKNELQNACQEFEAIILKKLLSSMRDSVPESGLYEESYAQETYQSMHDKNLSQELAHGKGTGLGEMMFNQLVDQQGD